jgi:hypothetical protein
MARKNVQLFYTSIKQEGDAGATRGKIPVAMGREMGAKDGDIIEWEVVNGDCVGGRVLSKAERKAHEREQSVARKASPAPKKAKPSVKSKQKVAKSSEDEAPRKKGKKVKHKLSKSGKRATKVSYDEAPAKGKKKLKKPKFKLGRR